MTETDYLTLKETANFYKKEKTPVHIWMNEKSLIGKQIFKRGLIISVGKKRLVLIEERSQGKILIFFERIKVDGIVPREKKRGPKE